MLLHSVRFLPVYVESAVQEDAHEYTFQAILSVCSIRRVSHFSYLSSLVMFTMYSKAKDYDDWDIIILSAIAQTSTEIYNTPDTTCQLDGCRPECSCDTISDS